MSFEKNIIVKEDDLDDLNHVNNVRYVQWIQDIAKEHWQSKASRELQDSAVWVVLTHHISYKRPSALGDEINMHTYISESKGAISVRMVEMFNVKTKKQLLSAKTEWCLINVKSQKPMRISEELKNIFLEPKIS